jgi:hypothetical protein
MCSVYSASKFVWYYFLYYPWPPEAKHINYELFFYICECFFQLEIAATVMAPPVAAVCRAICFKTFAARCQYFVTNSEYLKQIAPHIAAPSPLLRHCSLRRSQNVPKKIH